MNQTIVLLILLSISSKLFAQSDYKVIDNAKYVAVYQYNHKEDSTSNSIKTINMQLAIGSNKSLFQAQGKFYADSIVINSKNNSMKLANSPIVITPSPNRIVSHLTGYSIIKANGDNREINLYERIDNTTVKVPFDSKFEWKLSSNDTTILSHKCKRATLNYAGRNYVAWYTMQVPISDGPYIFSGLPGLIVYMADTKGEHVFELTQLTQNKKDDTISFPEYSSIEITTKQYIRAKEDDKIRKVKKYFNPKYLPNTPVEQLSAAERRILSNNNYIEKTVDI